ncbi:MAG: DUF3794 domain-containing protein [Marinisporobacter sp.]|nr:DUF3794 domain-containing protein [Marinisporobacter sp.]
MGIVRNSMNIEGLILEEDIPSQIKGQIIRYSEVETLHVPEDKGEVQNIYEIAMNIEIKSKRSIHAPFGNIIVVDGIKEYKIIYTENTKSCKANILELKVPFNTFIELPKEIDNILDIKIYILDAYFDVLDPRKIYGHFLYLVDVHYDHKDQRSELMVFKEDNHKENHLAEEMIYTDATIEEISVSEEPIKREREDLLIDLDEEIL